MTDDVNTNATPETVDAVDRARLDDVGVRRLAPENCQIFRGTFSLLHATVLGDQIYRGVFASLTFPVKHPTRLISLRYHDSGGKAREIGLIEDLAAFPDDARALIHESLAKHYHEQTITRIHRITMRYGLLFFEVDTNRGREEFMLRYQGDRAQDWGEHGKVLLDVFDNRYVIPDLRDLPARDRTRFVRHIYW